MNPNDKDLLELERSLRELAAIDRMRMDEAMTARLRATLRDEQRHARSRRSYRHMLAAAAMLALFCVLGSLLLGGGQTEQPVATTVPATEAQPPAPGGAEGGLAPDPSALAQGEAAAVPLDELGSATQDGYSPDPNFRYLSCSGLEFGLGVPGGFDIDVFATPL